MSNIVIKNVSKSFDGVEVLHDVNLDLEEGHIYGFIGRNGSGKSVLFKIICGLYYPTTGSVIVDGIDIHKNDIFPNDMRVLIEKPNFLPNLTGLDNLKLLASIQNRIAEEDIILILDKLNLKKDMNKLYHKYSLGMKQKLAVAQVLMENPKMMIFDEPFNGIEEKTVEVIKKILLEEKKEGKIILIASHIKEDIEELADADTIYFVDNGSVNNYKKK
jgi:ABC transporter related